MRPSFVMSGVASGLRRNLSMTIALILNTAIGLSFAGGAFLVSQEITKFRDNYVDKLNVSIYLCLGGPRAQGSPCTAEVTPAQRTALENKLRQDPRITSVEYISKEQSYQRAKRILPPDQADLVEPGQIPPILTIKLRDIKNDFVPVQRQYAGAPGVDQIYNQSDALKTILTIFDRARVGAIVVAIAILVCALLLMANAIQVAATQRRNETGIMRLVGASRWMTQLPFIIEAVIAAFIGGVLATVLNFVGKRFVLESIFRQQVENGILPQLSTNDVLLASGYGLIGGVVLAAITAYLTLRLLVRL